jgi:uncharacterized membrane protein
MGWAAAGQARAQRRIQGLIGSVARRLQFGLGADIPGAVRSDSVPSTMRLIRQLAGPFFVFAGVMHFVKPRLYQRIVPPYVPAPKASVYASGAAEIAGGVGLMIPRYRRQAGWWLIATLIGVFPANVHMALNAEDYPQIPGGATALWARLPLQAVFGAWVLGAAKR